MERSDPRYQAYVKILKEELIPAMGCTEPIALAYAAAKAREVLGMLPESVQLQVSGSIIKNVKSVIVPNTGHLKGMEAAVAAGIIAGSADRELEVISEVSEDKKAAIRDYLILKPSSSPPEATGATVRGAMIPSATAMTPLGAISSGSSRDWLLASRRKADLYFQSRSRLEKSHDNFRLTLAEY